MIIVTENQYLEGTGDIRKEVEYKEADQFEIGNGNLLVYQTPVNDTTPPKFKVLYNEKTWFKVTYKK